MIKWFAYIVVLLILIPWISSAKIKVSRHRYVFDKHSILLDSANQLLTDTTTKTAKQKQQEIDDKKKVKEVAKAKRLPKPEKVDDAQQKAKPKRQRRPPGLERPPEIPRRNGN
jgi:hypothetical protein